MGLHRYIDHPKNPTTQQEETNKIYEFLYVKKLKMIIFIFIHYALENGFILIHNFLYIKLT